LEKQNEKIQPKIAKIKGQIQEYDGFVNELNEEI
jgi:hypothetical protein